MSDLILNTIRSLMFTAIPSGGKTHIILSANNAMSSLGAGFKAVATGDLVVLPIVNGDLPEINNPQNNETFSSIRGDLAIIGTQGLRTVTIESLMPDKVNKYPFQEALGYPASEIIKFCTTKQAERIPIRLTIVSNSGNVYLNMACLVNNFTYHRDNVGDYHYKLDLLEYPMVNAQGGISS